MDSLPGEVSSLTAADILADGFVRDPVFRWEIGPRVGDDEARRRLRDYFQYLCDLDGAIVNVIDGAGATFSVRSDDDPLAFPRVLKTIPIAWKTFRTRMFTAGGPNALLAAMDQPSEPFIHMIYVGVHESATRQGIGRRLVTEFRDLCDAEGRLGYIESGTAYFDSVYADLGFTEAGPLKALPSTPPTVRLIYTP